VTKIVAMIAMNSVTPQAAAKHELLFNSLASSWQQVVKFSIMDKLIVIATKPGPSF
jgi:hypothetical protein